MDHPAQDEKPVVYVFHGDDPLAIKRGVENMVKHMGDPGLADMNITQMDGRHNSDDDIRSAANSMPFMVERRLVIVRNPFAKLTTDATRKRFLALLDGLPPSTALVLLVEDVQDRGDWKAIPKKRATWFSKWLEAAGPRALYKACALPSIHEMNDWVRKEAKRQGGQFEPDAAITLVSYIGNDTQQASLEINKLLTYADFKRPVEVNDVMEMTAQIGQADVFAMVDAMTGGNTRQAVQHLHRLLESQDSFTLFGMIVRQFRLLIQTRELLDEGHAARIAIDLRVPPFVADKLASQARRFKMAQLEMIYHRLLEIDEGIKTSQVTPGLAFDTFFASLA